MQIVEARTRRLINWRLLPWIILGHMICQLDRANLGVAALQMNESLSIGPEVFGIGAGIFFIGYAIFEIPSNFMLTKVGAPLWLGRIMFTWGVIACAMAFVQGPISFYVFRFTLGVAEAGWSPGVVLFLGAWYTSEQRAGAFSKWVCGTALAGVLGQPLSASLLSLHGLGLQGWQWMFILEGIPAVVLGLLFPWVLPASPRSASWLPKANSEELSAFLAKEEAAKAHSPTHYSFVSSLRSLDVWIFVFAYFCISVGIFSLIFWIPQLVRSNFGSLPALDIGVISALPYGFGVIGLLIGGWSSDRTQDRRWHLTCCAAFAGLALLIGTQTPDPYLAVLAICLATGCTFASIAIFWTVPMEILGGSAATGNMGLINAIGSLGGFLGPYLVGYFKSTTGSFNTGIAAFAVFFLAESAVYILCPRIFRRQSEVSGNLPVAELSTPTRTSLL